MPRLESPQAHPAPEKEEPHHLSEEAADRELEELLENPDNRFLNENPKNRTFIQQASSAVEALAFAKEQIRKREETTFTFSEITSVEGARLTDVNVEGLRNTLKSILENAEQIGQGGDAVVVIDKSEIRGLPPEICYKFMKKEQTPRGRNVTAEEARIHGEFHEVAQKFSRLKIGVPTPFYTVEIGERKMIAMEKLLAVSVDDVLRGRGSLPQWFDVDEYCTELTKAITAFHDQGLYHRDMHIGNIMISQARERKDAEKIGYIIDFGLSGHVEGGLDPYVREMGGATFTYDDDYGIISRVRKELLALQSRGEK